MNTEPELLNERLERLAMILDEIMPHCALLVRDALILLKEQPEIVRCKDCKHYEHYAGCKLLHDANAGGKDWFCADGVKKDG